MNEWKLSNRRMIRNSFHLEKSPRRVLAKNYRYIIIEFFLNKAKGGLLEW